MHAGEHSHWAARHVWGTNASRVSRVSLTAVNFGIRAPTPPRARACAPRTPHRRATPATCCAARRRRHGCRRRQPASSHSQAECCPPVCTVPRRGAQLDHTQCEKGATMVCSDTPATAAGALPLASMLMPRTGRQQNHVACADSALQCTGGGGAPDADWDSHNTLQERTRNLPSRLTVSLTGSCHPRIAAARGCTTARIKVAVPPSSPGAGPALFVSVRIPRPRREGPYGGTAVRRSRRVHGR